MTALWAGLTMCAAATHNMSQLAVIRFFQGMIEASTYSGTQYVIGSWYKPHEIGKRIGLFAASGMAGTMFAGKIAALQPVNEPSQFLRCPISLIEYTILKVTQVS